MSQPAFPAPPPGDPDPATVAAVGEASETEEGTKRGTVVRTTPTRAQAQAVRRSAESRATVPDWTASVEVDLAAALAVAAATPATPAPSALDLVARALGLVLPRHPRLLGTWRDGRFETWSRVNLGVLTDVGGGRDLLATTVYDADGTPLAELAEARRAVRQRAADGTLGAPDTAAQTFVLAAVDGDGADRFEVVPPPGIGAALSLGAVRERPWAVDGAVLVRPVATLTLCADHRIVHGVHGGALLGDLRATLEDATALAG